MSYPYGRPGDASGGQGGVGPGDPWVVGSSPTWGTNASTSRRLAGLKGAGIQPPFPSGVGMRSAGSMPKNMAVRSTSSADHETLPRSFRLTDDFVSLRGAASS